MAKATVDMAALVAATRAGSFMHVDADAAKKLVKDGLIEINTNVTNEAGEPAARATQKGMDAEDAKASKAAGGEQTNTAPAFYMGSVPSTLFTERKRGGAGKPDKYPFDQLPAPVEGQPIPAFFVAATDKMPEPAKSLSSTVSAASRRYARETGEFKQRKNRKTGAMENAPVLAFDRQFSIIAGEHKVGDQMVKGAWIGRIK